MKWKNCLHEEIVEQIDVLGFSFFVALLRTLHSSFGVNMIQTKTCSKQYKVIIIVVVFWLIFFVVVLVFKKSLPVQSQSHSIALGSF